MKKPNIVTIYTGTKNQVFKLVPVPPQKAKYIFTAYSNNGEFFDCFVDEKSDAYFCCPAVPLEGQMKNMEFIKTSGFSMNCRFYNSL